MPLIDPTSYPLTHKNEHGASRIDQPYQWLISDEDPISALSDALRSASIVVSVDLKSDTTKNEFNYFHNRLTGKFWPGPLLQAYHLAWAHPEKSVVLAILNIHLVKAADLFGDMLRAFDRHHNGPLAGFSQYRTMFAPAPARWAIKSRLFHESMEKGEFRFPPNFYIWATSSFQHESEHNADAHFRRRWSSRR